MRPIIRTNWLPTALLLTTLIWAEGATAGPAPVPPPKAGAAKAAPAKSDSSMTLKGGTEGTEFRTLTVEGEDRIHIDFDRPPIEMTLDPTKVAGLDLGTTQDVLDRTMPDLETPLVSLSRTEHCPYLARPWLHEFATGAVARFRPDVKGVERWKLLVANSRGETVATFQGKGEPPEDISWNGRAQNGAPVVPGLTYSYAFEAYDRAGNKRNFVGQGFAVSAYRIDGPPGPTLLFSAKDLTGARSDPIVLEAAGAWNEGNHLRDPIRILVSARTRDEANTLASRVSSVFVENTLGDPARIQTVTEIRSDAPEGGVVRIAPARQTP
jgi:hypothetical protein